jgi:hypothetical protein
MLRSVKSRLVGAIGPSVVLLIAVACGGSGSSKAVGDTQPTKTAKAPVHGGSLTMAMFSETRALDPVDAAGSGVAGGTELAALYDTSMR